MITRSSTDHVDESVPVPAFDHCELGPEVLAVAPGVLPIVLEWAERQPVPHVIRRSVHTPSVRAWAVLDGGVLHCFGFGQTTLTGGYVVGHDAALLLAAELDLPLPDGPNPADPTAEQLRQRLDTAPPDEPSAIEQAELLATCTDGVLMRWVATTLHADHSP